MTPAADTPPPAITEDSLLGGRVRLTQPREGYRAAFDPILLAAALPADSGARRAARVADLGCGTGAAALCLAARLAHVHIWGLEREAALAALARRNVEANERAERVEIVTGDVLAPPRDSLPPGHFDRVMLNPPYLPAARARPAAAPLRAAAEIEGEAKLVDWIAAARHLLRPRGHVTLIQRADRLDGCLAALAPGFGAVTVLPIWPRADHPARRVVIEARRDAAGPARLLPGLTLHRTGDESKLTAAAEAVIAGGAPLPGLGTGRRPG